MSWTPSSSRSILSSLLGGVARNGLSRGWQMATRSFNSYRVIGSPPYDLKRQQGTIQDILTTELNALNRLGAFETPSQLKLIVSGEGKFNQYYRVAPDGQHWARIDARYPISPEQESEAIEMVRAYMATQPAGTIYIMTNYVDCGPGTDGRRLGECRGVLIESGTGNFALFGKRYDAPTDGWDSNRFSVRAREGATYIRVKDTSGDGKDVVMRISICLDDAKFDYVYPSAPNIGIVIGSGAPRIGPRNLRTEVVTIEHNNVEFPEDDSSAEGMLDAYLTLIPRTPYAAQDWPIMSRVESAGFEGVCRLFRAAMEYFGYDAPPSFDATSMQWRIPERAKKVTVDGVRFLTMEPREIPPVREADVPRIEEVVADGDNVLNRPIGPEASPAAKQADENILERLREEAAAGGDPDKSGLDDGGGDDEESFEDGWSDDPNEESGGPDEARDVVA